MEEIEKLKQALNLATDLVKKLTEDLDHQRFLYASLLSNIEKDEIVLNLKAQIATLENKLMSYSS